MATYRATAPTSLIERIKRKSTDTNRAAAQALNRTATFAVNESTRMIVQRVNLETAYIKKHLRVAARASPANLRTIIRANERATLLTRYPVMRTQKGVRVAVNKGTGFRELPGAFIVGGLRGSQATGVALRNKDALAFFERSASKGLRTDGKSSKLARLREKAAKKPRGIYVLHSRSINNLFTSVREDVSPGVQDFLLEDFLSQLKRIG